MGYPARNVLLFTLLLDNAECESPRDLWDVFHAFFIDAPNANALRFSMASLLSRITIDPEICHGKPTVRGLHYPVDALLEQQQSGDQGKP